MRAGARQEWTGWREVSNLNMLKINRIKRQRRIRKRIEGKRDFPRLSVFRSNRYIYAQAIDDTKGETIASISQKNIKKSPKELGVIFAEKLKKLKVEKIAFDKGGFKYHGIVKLFAEGLREGGLKF